MSAPKGTRCACPCAVCQHHGCLGCAGMEACAYCEAGPCDCDGCTLDAQEAETDRRIEQERAEAAGGAR